MGKRSKTQTVKSQVFAASFSGSSGHEFSAVAGPQVAGCGTPDLDIVSGFAFLSFDSLDALELHIDVNEANTSTLSVQVGQKRPHGSHSGPIEGPSRTDTPAKKSKRSPKPKPKSKKPSKPKQGLGVQQQGPPDANIPSKTLQAGPLVAEGCEEISLLCPETIQEDEIREVGIPPPSRSDVCVVEPAGESTVRVFEQLDAATSDLLPKKQKKKKKKKKEALCDQTSQTMFRIKKKKKKQSTDLAKENQLKSKASTSAPESGHFGGGAGLHIDISNSDGQLMSTIESCQGGENAGGPGGEIPISGNYQDIELLEGYHRSARPKKTKIEKVDWCARSGGAFVMNKYRAMKTRYHPMSLSMVREEKYRIEGETYGMLESASSTPEGSDLDPEVREEQLASIVKLEDNTPSEASSDELPKEFLFSNETFMMKREGDENEADPGEIEVDIESVDTTVSKNFIVVSGIKGTPNSPAGHFSFHPHLTRDGTVDSSIQTYANEIEVYLKCAMLQHGEIIKVITPDKDDFEGKYLQNPDGLKAVRSFTERKRRNFLGQMFVNLKMEVFTDLVDRELYFSKQTILTKAAATVDELVKQGEELSLEKAQLKEQSRVLREKLNHLVFGESARADQVVDTEKLGSVLKHFNIEVEEPLEDVMKPSDFHTVKTPPLPLPPTSTTTQTTQTPSAVYHDKERGYYALVKTGISTPTASKPSVTTAPKLVPQVVTDAKSSTAPVKVRSVPCQVSSPSGRIICNLSRVKTQRSSGNGSNICLVTNVNPAMKSLERKNVMHIKITNDVLKQVDEASASAPGQQAKANMEPRNPSSASVTCKPQVMLGTLIAKKVVPPTTKIVQLPPSPEPSTSQAKAKQSSGRHLRPILPHPAVATEVLAGISNIVKTVNSPSILQHLSLPQKSGGTTPIVFPRVQDTEELAVNEPIIQRKQSTSDPQSATGIDGLKGVVDKLSQEQQSLVVKRKILVPVKVPQAEVILLPSGAFLPKPVKLGSSSNMPNPISHLPSTFPSSAISNTQGTARSPGFGGSTPNTTSGLSLTQSSPSGNTHASSSGLQLILGRVCATPMKVSQGNSATHLQQPNVNVSTSSASSHTTFVSPRISGGVQSTSSFALKTTPQTFRGGNKPLSSTESVPTSSPLTVHSVPASTPGRLYSVSSQTAARVLHKKVAPAGQTSVPLSTQGSQHFCATVSTAAPVAPVSATPGATQHRQMTIKLPLSNMQSSALPSPSSASCVIPLHSFTKGTGIIDPNLVTAQLGQGAIQARTPPTSTVHYSLPNAQVKQSTFPQSISSSTTVVPMHSPKVHQLPQSPILGSLQMRPESAAHSNIPVHMPMVVVDKPWITARQVSTGDSVAQPGNLCSPSVQSSSSSKMFPEILESILSPVDISQAPLMEMRGSLPSLPQALPPSETGKFSADIVWPQVPELAPVSHYIIPAMGGTGSLAQAEESTNIPSAFVTRIPVTDWRESVDIPYLVSGNSLEASEEAVNSPSTEMTMGQSASIHCEGDQLKTMQTNPVMSRFDVRDHTYSKQKTIWPTSD